MHYKFVVVACVILQLRMNSLLAGGAPRPREGCSVQRLVDDLRQWVTDGEKSLCPGCVERSFRELRFEVTSCPSVVVLGLRSYVYAVGVRGFQVLIWQGAQVELGDSFNFYGREYDLWAVVSQSNSHCWSYIWEEGAWLKCGDANVSPAGQRLMDVGFS